MSYTKLPLCFSQILYLISPKFSNLFFSNFLIFRSICMKYFFFFLWIFIFPHENWVKSELSTHGLGTTSLFRVKGTTPCFMRQVSTLPPSVCTHVFFCVYHWQLSGRFIIRFWWVHLWFALLVILVNQGFSSILIFIQQST